MSSLQENWRNRQNVFCLEVRGLGRIGGRNDPNNVSTLE
jgi:hypothetical protein